MFESAQYVLKPGSIVEIGDIITFDPTIGVPNPKFSIVTEIYGEFSGNLVSDSLSRGCFKKNNLFIIRNIVPVKDGKYTIVVKCNDNSKKFTDDEDSRIGIFGPLSAHNNWQIYTKI